tara:strand:- start:261 stop:782 length:522 start_codon:yes stop_codon:yes gene_type:complete
MINSYKKAWANSFNLDKRTTKNEFFAFYILDVIIFGLLILGIALQEVIPSLGVICVISFFLYLFGGFIPRVTCLIRRIKDTGRSTAWIFWAFVPFLGTLVLFVIALQPSSNKRKDSFPVGVTDTVPVSLVDNSTLKSVSRSKKSELNEIEKLKEEGLISEEEYEKSRKKILGI